MSNIYIGSDNAVVLSGLFDVVVDDYVNNADSVVMSLFRDTKLSLTSGTDATQEVQRLLIDAPATAGNWTLSYRGQTTSSIAYNASLATIKTALENLSTIEVDDVVVSGNTLDTNPVGNGMYFTWAASIGDASLLTFDVSGLTGPTQAGSALTEITKGILQGSAINEGGGSVGIPVIGHSVEVGHRVRFANTFEYNKMYLITDTEVDKVVFTETYAAEDFVGHEVMYSGIEGGTNIAMSYISGTDGNYRGILPDDMKGIIERAWYYLFIESKKDDTARLDCVKWQATYSSLEIP